MLRYNPLAVAELLALAPETPTFNAGIIHTALVYVAGAVIMALGIVIMVKYTKRGEVGEATNSALVIAIGATFVVGSSMVLVFAQLIANATAK